MIYEASLSLTVILIFVFLLIHCWIQYGDHIKKYFKKVKQDKEDREYEECKSVTVSLLSLRRYRYEGVNACTLPGRYFIKKSMMEGLSIFISFASQILSFNGKLMKFLLEAKEEYDTGNDETVKVNNRIILASDCIQALYDTALQLEDRMYDIYLQSDKDEYIQVDEEIVIAYADMMAQIALAISDNLQISGSLDIIIEEKYPLLLNPFNIGRRKFLEIYFVEILNCSTMIDKSINVERKEGVCINHE